MIDLDEQFAQAWEHEPPLPAPADRLVAGRRRLRHRRTVTTTLGSVAVVAVIVAAGSAAIGGGTPRSAAPDFATTSPSVSTTRSLGDRFPVADPPGYVMGPLWSDDHHVYRSADDVEVLRVDDSRPILDPVTGRQVGHEVVVETTWQGKTSTQYFDFADGRYRGGGDDKVSYDEYLAGVDAPLFFDTGPDYFELFDSPVGIDSSGLRPKAGATIESQRQARAGEFSSRRFHAAAPSVGTVTIAGLRYYAIAGYTSAGKDVIVAQQADGRSLEQFLAEVKAGMDDGSIKG